MSTQEEKALFCFLDIETTGKNKYKDELWSCSYQLDLIKLRNPDPQLITPVLDLKEYIVYTDLLASPWVVNNTNYSHYFNYKGEEKDLESQKFYSKLEFISHFLQKLEKQKQLWECKMFLVGANPSFDNCFLERLKNEYFPEEEMPWDFHLIDIEQMVYAQSCKTTLKPPSLAKSLEIMTGTKLKSHYTHNSKHDVISTREVFYKLLLG